VVAGRIVAREVVDADLAVKPDGGARHKGFAVMHTGAVDGVAGGEVVGAVEHDIGGRHQRIEFGAGQPGLERNDVDFRIDRRQRLAARFRLGHANAGLGVENLALQVGEIDRVVIDQRNPADTR